MATGTCTAWRPVAFSLATLLLSACAASMASDDRDTGVSTPPRAQEGVSSDGGTEPDAAGSAAPKTTKNPRMPAPFPIATSAFEPDADLKLCPKIQVANAPAAGADRSIYGYTPFALANRSVIVLRAPTTGACLSSGFGERRGRMHRGTDLHQRPGGPIHAAADGVILEKTYRDDYGNMILMDHGNGVYTRYAHLANFASGLREGTRLDLGDTLGTMGRTSKFKVALHLHYELLTGDYNNPKKSFGLIAVNPMALPNVTRQQ